MEGEGKRKLMSTGETIKAFTRTSPFLTPLVFWWVCLTVLFFFSVWIRKDYLEEWTCDFFTHLVYVFIIYSWKYLVEEGDGICLPWIIHCKSSWMSVPMSLSILVLVSAGRLVIQSQQSFLPRVKSIHPFLLNCHSAPDELTNHN